MLGKLERAQDLDLDALKRTMVGKTVNSLRKHSHEQIRAKVKELIKSWKRLQTSGSGNSNGVAKRKMDPADGGAAKRAKPEKLERGDEGEAQKVDKEKSKRAKAVEKFAVIFNAEADGNEVAIEMGQRIATDLEKVVHDTLGRDDGEYLRKLKQLFNSLRKNKELCCAVTEGRMKLDKLVTLRSDQLASRDIQEKMKAVRAEKAEAARSDWDEANFEEVNKKLGIKQIASLFTCGKCKSTKTTSYQVQTRSADEPMTVFVTCMDCGNKWKC